VYTFITPLISNYFKYLNKKDAMKTLLYLIITYSLIFPYCSFAQKLCHIEADTVSKKFILVQDKASNITSRILDLDIQTTVSAHATRPESTIDIHLNFGTDLNLENLFTIIFTIRPYCSGICNDAAIAESWLSTKAINKASRSVNFTMGGMIPGKSYTLETSIFGFDGAPCSGRMITPVTFQTSSATAELSKMLLVINEEWKNTALVQSSLDQYIADVQANNPLITVEKYYVTSNSFSKIGLYDYIQQQYTSANLSYLFFIGDNASTLKTHRLLDEQGGVPYEGSSYSFTHYTLPLYQNYTYDPSNYNLKSMAYQNTCFRPSQEVREAVFQQRNSLISMGMIIPDPALSFDGQINYLNQYFIKLHKFKNKEITFEKKVLLTDGFVNENSVVSLAKNNGRWNNADILDIGREKDVNYSGEDVVWKTDFINKLGSRSYEIFSLNLHGSPNYHSFGIYSSDILYNFPQLNTQIINLSSCNVGHYKYHNYLAGLYLEKGNVLNVHAYSDLLITLTSNGASALEYQFLDNGVFTLMSRGYTISDAFRFSASYIDSEVILGDPLVKLSEPTPLPVSLKNFEVNKEGKTAHLVWSTVFENASSHFEVERSEDGKKWTALGSVVTNNKQSGDIIYSFSDKNPLQGENLYRLKMIDLDGTYSFSKIQHTRFDYLDIMVFPNPASDKIYLSNELLESAESVVVTNYSGKTLFESNAKFKDGILINKFPSGIYLIRVKMTDQSVKNLKMVVER
jgi:hypothetical protein